MKTKIKSMSLALCLSLPTAVIGLTGCNENRNPPERTAGEYVDDKALGARVKRTLADNSEYKFDDVNVTVYRDTVQLNGFVNTADQKKKAAEIAEKVPGVKKVENGLTLKEKAK